MSYTRVLAGAAALVLLAGCASRPLPALRPVDTQLSLESAAHWNELAAKTARDIIAGLAGEGIPIELDEGNGGPQMVLGLQSVRPFFVKPEVATPFGRAFNDMLVTHLVRQGAAVTTRSEDAYVVDYRVEFISYAGERDLRTFPGPITVGSMIAATAVGTGFAASSEIIAGATAGSLATVLAADAGWETLNAPDGAEVLVTTQVTYGDRYLMRRSDVYYVRPDDIGQYVARARPSFASRTYRLVTD